MGPTPRTLVAHPSPLCTHAHHTHPRHHRAPTLVAHTNPSRTPTPCTRTPRPSHASHARLPHPPPHPSRRPTPRAPTPATPNRVACAHSQLCRARILANLLRTHTRCTLLRTLAGHPRSPRTRSSRTQIRHASTPVAPRPHARRVRPLLAHLHSWPLHAPFTYTHTLRTHTSCAQPRRASKHLTRRARTPVARTLASAHSPPTYTSRAQRPHTRKGLAYAHLSHPSRTPTPRARTHATPSSTPTPRARIPAARMQTCRAHPLPAHTCPSPPSRMHHLCARAPPLPSHRHSSCARTHACHKHAQSRTNPASFRRPALADELLASTPSRLHACT
ncbi:hypothetical protein K438DRAFT_1973692 [Mycena galopus ATCC 62051]|nr:hypothetical protein K438DRAFT_1973692 [Mycena galopus ATCC 62051]